MLRHPATHNDVEMNWRSIWFVEPNCGKPKWTVLPYFFCIPLHGVMLFTLTWHTSPLSSSSAGRHQSVSSQPDGHQHLCSCAGRREILWPRKLGWAQSGCGKALEDGGLGRGAWKEGGAVGEREKSLEAGNRKTPTRNGPGNQQAAWPTLRTGGRSIWTERSIESSYYRLHLVCQMKLAC